jgi:membrane protein implicated in regulation of membrane protease activity
MSLLGTVLLALAAALALMAVAVGIAMVIDPALIQPGLIALVLLAALAAANAVVGRRLREEDAEARAWDEDDEPWDGREEEARCL